MSKKEPKNQYVVKHNRKLIAVRALSLTEAARLFRQKFGIEIEGKHCRVFLRKKVVEKGIVRWDFGLADTGEAHPSGGTVAVEDEYYWLE